MVLKFFNYEASLMLLMTVFFDVVILIFMGFDLSCH